MNYVLSTPQSVFWGKLKVIVLKTLKHIQLILKRISVSRMSNGGTTDEEELKEERGINEAESEAPTRIEGVSTSGRRTTRFLLLRGRYR